MTKLTNCAAFFAALSILFTSCLMPSALAQSTDASKTTVSEKAAAPKKAKTAGTNARKSAKLKSSASKDIEKGVEKAGSNLNK